MVRRSSPVSTRAVTAAAQVQAPTIYRLFGDKQGLLDAVAVDGYATYVAGKGTRELARDPVEDLRRGWDQHLEFALANPALYVLMTAPRPGARPPAVNEGIAHLREIIHRIAAEGRLAVTEEHALQVVIATGQGATLMVLNAPEAERDRSVSQLAREAVIDAITNSAPTITKSGPASAAITLHAALDDITVLSNAERALLADWLDRIATGN